MKTKAESACGDLEFLFQYRYIYAIASTKSYRTDEP